MANATRLLKRMRSKNDFLMQEHKIVRDKVIMISIPFLIGEIISKCIVSRKCWGTETEIEPPYQDAPLLRLNHLCSTAGVSFFLIGTLKKMATSHRLGVFSYLYFEQQGYLWD
jgi:hypothetical protein